MVNTQFECIAFVSSGTEEADEAATRLRATYGTHALSDADVVVALGGDGLMLETLHQVMKLSVPVYGMNFGTIGFLMNAYEEENLPERLKSAESTFIAPLKMEVDCIDGGHRQAFAFNEVSLFRASYQAAKIRISIDEKIRLEELICDGVLIATPAGSTAYNLSAHGPILPIDSPLLALTPISPFRPRRWRGAILPNSANVNFSTHESVKRPVNAAADNVEFKNVSSVSVTQDHTNGVTLLFNPGHNLEERVINEQFVF